MLNALGFCQKTTFFQLFTDVKYATIDRNFYLYMLKLMKYIRAHNTKYSV